jgi:hypothetical protein
MLEESLIRWARKCYPHQGINCSQSAVEDRIREHPPLFSRARAKARRYTKRLSYESGLLLWNTCHLFDLITHYPWCEYCRRAFSEQDFMGPVVHLEHRNPRSSPQVSDIDLWPGRLYTAHHPHLIVLACASCNIIKSNLCDADLQKIVENPASLPEGKEHLRDFAAIYYIHIVAPQGYAAYHGIDFIDVPAHLEQLQEAYRRKWGDQVNRRT